MVDCVSKRDTRKRQEMDNTGKEEAGNQRIESKWKGLDRLFVCHLSVGSFYFGAGDPTRRLNLQPALLPTRQAGGTDSRLTYARYRFFSQNVWKCSTEFHVWYIISVKSQITCSRSFFLNFLNLVPTRVGGCYKIMYETWIFMGKKSLFIANTFRHESVGHTEGIGIVSLNRMVFSTVTLHTRHQFRCIKRRRRH